jgi:pyruvate dehydrogenase E1 component beta subunit
MDRELKFFEAIREATDLCMAKDPTVYVMGLGVSDPKSVFGTTLGLEQKYGSKRVIDMPTSENGMTGVAIGSSLVGMRPIMVHQRVEFAMLAMEQIVNQAAKWCYMFGGQMSVPLVIRLIIGRGWGQGPQHSQSLQAWFAHIPGLKVVMPVMPYDAKGMLIASVEDNNPVIFIEHRWLHNIFGNVPKGIYHVPLGQARIARSGKDITIVAISYMVLEALRAAESLAQIGIEVEVVDVRSLRPLDSDLILESVRKTGRAIIADTSWVTGGFSGEIVSIIVEKAFTSLKSPPQRLGLADCPTPSSRALAKFYYPGAIDIIAMVGEVLGIPKETLHFPKEAEVPLDVPDRSFTGPF